MSCTSSCTFNTSGCYKCGDGVINGAEQCDGMQLGGKTCILLGFSGGTLACTSNCTFDTSGCTSSDPCGVPAITFSTKSSAPFVGTVRAAANVDGTIRIIRNGNSQYGYNPVTDVWTVEPAIPSSEPIFGETYAALAAGLPGQFLFFDVNTVAIPSSRPLEQYSTASKTWTRLYNVIPNSHWGGAVGQVGGLIFLIANYGANFPDAVDIYNTASNTFSSGANVPGPGTQGLPGYAVSGTGVFLFGGVDGSTGLPIARVARYDTAANSWTIKSPLPSKRQSAVAFERSGVIYVLGGFTGSTYLDEIIAYNPTADTNCTMAAKLPQGMLAFVAIPVGQKAYVIGGVSALGDMSTTYELSFSP